MIDGIKLKKITNILNDQYRNIRIEKIHQPEEKLLIFKVNTRDFKNLVISTKPEYCTFQFSNYKYDNPLAPSMFVMHLRKILENGKIREFKQLGYDRFITLVVDSKNELGEENTYDIHLELMGKYSNIIITKDNIIIEALHKYPIGINGIREILPKREYQLPPLSKKEDLDTITLEKLYDLFGKNPIEELSNLEIIKTLQRNLEGFSKDTLFTLLNNLEQEENQDKILYIYEKLKNLKIDLEKLSDEDKLFLETESQNFINYFQTATIDNYQRKLLNIVGKAKKKIQKKKDIYLKNIYAFETQKGEKFKLYGDILQSQIYLIEKGMKEITLKNYFVENQEEVTIPLEEHLSPGKNITKYYKKYKRIKEGAKHSTNLLIEVNHIIDYYESIEEAINICSTAEDLNEITEELKDEGIIKDKKKKGYKKKKTKINIKEMTIEGFRVLYGTNNTQNDAVTFKESHGGDLWFHTKDFPSAHFLLKNPDQQEVPETVIKAIATYCAQNSQGKDSNKVEVDYALKKFVKKHPSGKPGNVIYTNYQSILVNPLE